MGKIKIVILDLDQTIVDSCRRFHEIFNSKLVEFGGEPVDWNRFRALYAEDRLDELIPEGVEREVFWKAFRRSYNTIIHPEDKLIPGVEDTLIELRRRGLKIVVTTGREVQRDDIWRELEYFNIKDLVDEVYTLLDQDPGEEFVIFSRTGLINKILSAHNLSPSEALFVGDYWVDMESGRRAGVITVGVLTGHEPAERLLMHGANYIIEDINSLPSLLDEIESKP